MFFFLSYFFSFLLPFLSFIHSYKCGYIYILLDSFKLSFRLMKERTKESKIRMKELTRMYEYMNTMCLNTWMLSNRDISTYYHSSKQSCIEREAQIVDRQQTSFIISQMQNGDPSSFSKKIQCWWISNTQIVYE